MFRFTIRDVLWLTVVVGLAKVPATVWEIGRLRFLRHLERCHPDAY
jgi:hypothetical protein